MYENIWTFFQNYKIKEGKTMINTQYSTNNDILVGRTATAVKPTAIAEKAETEEKEVKVNQDTFEHRTTESAHTYSPDSIAKSVNSTNGVNTTSTTYVATTDAQKKRIPYFLAAKMAGLNFNHDTGSPSINSAYEYQAYQRAWDTIKGDHRKLSYKSEYCYAQNGSNNYGYSNAGVSCPTFALATALSIKEGKQITPDQIETNSKTDGTNTQWDKHGATRIAASEEDCLLAVDAQLQLGNPALIHINGKNVANDSSDQHWVTVIGKKDNDYIIIDPYNGKEKMLSAELTYKNGGTIADYVILSNEY